MSSVIAGLAIMAVGVVVVLVAILGARRGRSHPAPPHSAWLDYSSDKATAIVPVRPQPEAPVATIPPPPPSKTSGLHFAPASIGTSSSPRGRRYSGSYVRRGAPKRSTATRKPESNAS